jgi:hypothetical protein
MQLATTSTCEPLPMKWVERIFAELGALYGSKFVDQWGSQDPATLKAFWAQKLAGLSGDELRRGLTACEQRDWPPTLPEFLKLCRPPMNHTALWYEAQAAAKEREAGEVGTWSAPWVFHAYREMAHELRTGEFAKHGERWKGELEKAKAKVERGELPAEIPPPPKALPAPEPLSRDEAKVRAAALKVEAPTIRRGTEWAERLLARVKAGERLPVAHVDMARRALMAHEEAPPLSTNFAGVEAGALPPAMRQGVGA